MKTMFVGGMWPWALHQPGPHHTVSGSGLEGGGVSSSVFCVETERSILLNTSAHWGSSSLALPTLLKEAERMVLTSLKELYMEKKELSPPLKKHKAEVRVNSPYFERDC